MTISPPEAAWSYFWLKAELKRIPSARNYTPYYNADSWDLDDLFRAFKDEALTPFLAGNVLPLLIEGKKWPRLKAKELFWIRERWGSAQAFCYGVFEPTIGLDRVVPSSKPADPIALLTWLLCDRWESDAVDGWCRDNARWYIAVEDYSFPDRAVDLEIFLRKLEGKPL